MVERMMERLRVLVVDDNHHMVNIVKTILRGFGVKEFVDLRESSEAFEAFRAATIDLVITDYAMEPITGCDLTRRIRTDENSPNHYVPVIMLSAYSERSKVETARDSGISEFCTKPVTAMELYRKVQAAINSPRPFIRTQGYFGPDRRRRRIDDYSGEERRDALFGPRGGSAETLAREKVPEETS